MLDTVERFAPLPSVPPARAGESRSSEFTLKLEPEFQAQRA